MLTNQLVRIVLSMFTILLALLLGFFIRRLLLKQFPKNSLSALLARIVSALIIAFLLFLALIIIITILTGNPSLLTLLLGLGTPTDQKNSFQHFVAVFWNITFTGLACILGLLLAANLRSVILQQLEKRHIANSLLTLIGRASYVLVLLLIFVGLLIFWNVQITLPLSIITGVLTFALRDLIKDIVSGVYILGERQFEAGDEITVGSLTGIVTNINIRTTTLHLLTGEEMIVPNGRFFDDSVINNSRYKNRRATITATFAQSDYQAEQTTHQILQTIQQLTIVSPDHEPAIIFNAVTGRIEGYNAEEGGYNQETVELSIRFWVASSSRSAATTVMEALKKAFPRADFRLTQFADSI